MRSSLCFAALILALPLSAGAFEFPPTSLGAYAGVYLLECPAINNNVICVNGDPALGAAPVFGGLIRLALPKSCFLEVNLGHSSQGTVSSEPNWPKDSLITEGTLVIIPLALALGRHSQAMPRLWWTAGLKAGYTLATLEIDSMAHRSDGSLFSSHHAGRGEGFFLGFLLGLDIKIHRRLDLSVNFDYHFGDIKRLEVIASDDPARIGFPMEYYDLASETVKPLPVEVSQALLYYTLKFNF